MTNSGIPMWHDSEDRDRGLEPDYYEPADDRRDSTAEISDNGENDDEPQDDRRERYAADSERSERELRFFYAVFGQHAPMHVAEADDWATVHAAMAVADGEIGRQAELVRDEMLKRAYAVQKADELTADNARLRESLKEYQARDAEQNIRAREANEEIARLSAELEDAQQRGQYVSDSYNVANSALIKANATIERVRAVLDGKHAGWLLSAGEIRAALEGEQR